MKLNRSLLALLLILSAGGMTLPGCGSKEPFVVGEGTELPPEMTPDEEAEYLRQMNEMSKG